MIQYAKNIIFIKKKINMQRVNQNHVMTDDSTTQ